MANSERLFALLKTVASLFRSALVYAIVNGVDGRIVNHFDNDYAKDSLMNPSAKSHIRLIKEAPRPLGLYFRPGYNGGACLRQILAENINSWSGIVIDPSHDDRHETLCRGLVDSGREAVLDPMMLEITTPGGLTQKRAKLSWAASHLLEDLQASNRSSRAHKIVASRIANAADALSCNAVLAPTHFLENVSDDWIDVDQILCHELRSALDKISFSNVPIYYPLALSGSLLRSKEARERLIQHLARLPIDAVWLRIHPFGTNQSGPMVLRGYIEACRELHRIGLPLVAERSGTVGVALMAFGAVGGIESGITFGEAFDFGRLRKPQPKAKGFSPAPRVYIPSIGAFLTAKQAHGFFSNRRMKSRFGCRGFICCKSWAGMLENPKRHFVIQRISEVARLSRVQPEVRSRLYLEDFLRPATDLALEASKVLPSLDTTRKRLESWRLTLSAIQQDPSTPSIGQAAEGKRVGHKRGA